MNARTPLAVGLEGLGAEMMQLVRELYPICRSITGDGVRQTLAAVARHIPLALHEVPSGTRVFDWEVPREWNIREAWVRGPDGNKIIDFAHSSLHILNYSLPFRGRLPLAELRPHLFTLPAHPDWIPYRTSYYKENWGFCISQAQYDALPEGEYEICIDASLEPGSLTYGECYLPGECESEILLSCHVCHPSLCNDNLSGIALATFLGRHLAALPRRYSYRILFIPGTIGAIAWLARNEARTHRIKHGLVVTCVGDPGAPTYKKSRQGQAEIDRAVQHVLKHGGTPYQVLEFSPYGYDERQFCSPGFDLPVGSLTRTRDGCYPQYHTSADNLDLVQPVFLADSYARYLEVLSLLERNRVYLNLNPKCEPRLGKHGLYRSLGGVVGSEETEMALLWVLNLSDGRHALLDIAERSGLRFNAIAGAAELLLQASLLAEVD